ncbi:Uncharacterized protein dnm_076600 [Desulfonema magnum]|uniref:Uncharacterized protein n=1 Tax=Desulfonema magnum TaxID=45655 RepID=A0A975GS21_9BACT|nr:Uncharacterized protein dnm_076600 [Desulfonema magnum]
MCPNYCNQRACKKLYRGTLRLADKFLVRKSPNSENLVMF